VEGVCRLHLEDLASSIRIIKRSMLTSGPSFGFVSVPTTVDFI
jgi:hypothetical protein